MSRIEMQYDKPTGPVGYSYGSFDNRPPTSTATASDNNDSYNGNGYAPSRKKGLAIKISLRPRVTRDNTSLNHTTGAFGIPSVTNRQAPAAAGFGSSAYPGPLQNRGYTGVSSVTPFIDPSFGGGAGQMFSQYTGMRYA